MTTAYSRDQSGPEPYEFTSEEAFTVSPGRYIYGIDASQIPEGMWDPTDLSGLTVVLNGEKV